jgi:hypothetical protein
MEPSFRYEATCDFKVGCGNDDDECIFAEYVGGNAFL